MADHLREISTHELVSIFGKPEYQIIDVSPTDDYNGWRMNNEPRGGHNPHAKSVAVKWL